MTLTAQLPLSRPLDGAVCALALAAERRDSVTAGHCARLADLCVRLGRRLGLCTADLETLHWAGYLHDIGKVAIPDSILFKAGPLSDAEWDVMRTHTVEGEEICRPVAELAPVLPVIRHHHERWDGTGYPDRLKGEDIPLLARILQVADIYDALTAQRPYKRGMRHTEAVAILQQEALRGWRDPVLVAAFAAMFPSLIDVAV